METNYLRELAEHWSICVAGVGVAKEGYFWNKQWWKQPSGQRNCTMVLELMAAAALLPVQFPELVLRIVYGSLVWKIPPDLPGIL